jgi:membrane protein YdbS with pleckstrin-like domain
MDSDSIELEETGTFQNKPLMLEDLPQLEETNFIPLGKEYLYLRLTSWGIFFLLAAAVLVMLFFVADVPLYISMSIFSGLVLLIFLLEILGFKIKGYAMREHDITYKTGLIFFKRTSVPFNRIQHCEVSQGPLGRLFDLASVKVYTAGGSSSDLSISGLEKETAHKLREHITQEAAAHV